MKTIVATLLATVFISGLLLSAAAQPAQTKTANSNDLSLNFVNTPLDQVLAYLCDAADFIVVQQTRPGGYVTIKGAHLTRDEVVDLLNSELNRNNYAAIRDGRTLTIVNKNDAKTRGIPVLMGNDPARIPNNDTIATWIVPIRFVEARQLVSDLSAFVSAQATVVANEAGNTILITDTQANVRHLVQIIQAVDNTAQAETEIRVFPLKYASPVDVANELASVFPGSGSSDSQSPIQFGGGPGGGNPFAAMLGGGDGNNATQQRLQKATQVSAVADSRTQSVIVTAPKNLMNEIAGIVAGLDVKSDRDQSVSIIQLKNGDPQQVAQVLQSMFSSGSASSAGAGTSASSALQTRAQNAASQMNSGTTTSSGIGSTGTGSGGGTGGRAGGG